jgi:pilus assembly protein CpaD
MTKRKSFAALLALGTVALTAVGADARPARYESAANHSLDSENQPVVQRFEFVLDLAGGPQGVSDPELARLDAWFHSLGLGYGDRISVDGPYGGGRARADVGRVAAAYGLLLADGAPITPGALRSGAVRVVVSRGVASVPGCPKWRNAEGPSVTSANYGCATNTNLAAMVADPNDLVLGQVGSPVGDPVAAAKAIKVYRDTPPTGSKGLTAITTSSSGNH